MATCATSSRAVPLSASVLGETQNRRPCDSLRLCFAHTLAEQGTAREDVAQVAIAGSIVHRNLTEQRISQPRHQGAPIEPAVVSGLHAGAYRVFRRVFVTKLIEPADGVFPYSVPWARAALPPFKIEQAKDLCERAAT